MIGFLKDVKIKKVSFNENVEVHFEKKIEYTTLENLLFKLPISYIKKIKYSKFLIVKIIKKEIFIFEKFQQPATIKNLMLRGEKKYLELKYGIIFEPDPIQIKNIPLEKYDLFTENKFMYISIFNLKITTMHEYCRLSINCIEIFNLM